MNWPLESDPCPCRSGRSFSKCCLGVDLQLRPAGSRTTPKPPRTGESNPRCYASILNDCSATISREHYLSKCVLEMLSESNMIALENFRVQGAEGTKLVSLASLTGKILCDRHNSALSALDTIASGFYKTYETIHSEFADRRLRREKRFFSSAVTTSNDGFSSSFVECSWARAYLHHVVRLG